MRKTSGYLEEADQECLREIANREGRSQADVIRDASRPYADGLRKPREFALDGVVSVPGRSAAERSGEELLRGFGE